MKIEIKPDGIWYHGSNMVFSELRTNSTGTQWKELAEAFSHKPSGLGYDDDGVICHNGTLIKHHVSNERNLYNSSIRCSYY